MGMNRYYDNWERLVDAVIRREQFLQLCSLDDSRSPSTRSFDSQFSFSSNADASLRPTPSPLHQESVSIESRRRGLRVIPSMKKNMLKGLSIFGGFPFSSKKGFTVKEESSQAQWATPQKTFHGSHEPIYKSTTRVRYNDSFKELTDIAEQARRRAEIARLREQRTLKGHIESVMKTKGLDLDSIQHSYTI